MKIYKNISELVGNTPLFEAEKFAKENGVNAKLLLKLEYFNPAGSVKDRVALNMLERAKEQGILKEGATVIEPTSGNTGIGLAAVGGAMGYKVILVMPENMSKERIATMRAYGAEVILTDAKKGMRGAIEKAEEISKNTAGSIIAGQFVNPANPEAHKTTTAPEIWRDTGGKIDAFVAGVGTGGTISGVGAYLKEKNPDIKIIAVEPFSSPVLSGGKAGFHGLQGIGAGFVPENFDRKVCDGVITVTEEQAYSAARELAKLEGLLVGISSGAALYAAVKLALSPDNDFKNIVVLLPDSGVRYLSTPLFA